ncbi:MAG: hypothetical protein ACOYK7_13480 [Pirellulales bacterium]
MMRKQWRNGGWIAPLSLAATAMLAAAAAPSVAQQAQQDQQVGSASTGGWLSGESVSETVIGDRVVDAGSQPAESAPAPGDAQPLNGWSGDEVAAPGQFDDGSAGGLPAFEDDLAGGPHGDACGCPECAAAFEQPGFMQVLHDHLHGCWTLRADALLLWRNAPRLRPIYSDYLPGITPNNYGATALDANQLESTPAAGPRFSLFRSNNCGEAIEATWFRAANFRAQQATPASLGGCALTPPGVFGNTFTGLDTATADLGSSLQSFEFNRRWHALPNVVLLQGFRWFEWNESLSLVDHYGGSVEPALMQDIFNNTCINSLYGYQLGTDIRLWDRGGWFRLDGLLKGGAYYNNAVQKSQYVYDTGVGPGLKGLRVQGDGAAFVGELGLTTTVPLSKHFDLRAGYMALWLEGLAQPTNQLSGQTIPSGISPVSGTIDLTGGTVVQGVSLGVEGRW